MWKSIMAAMCDHKKIIPTPHKEMMLQNGKNNQTMSVAVQISWMFPTPKPIYVVVHDSELQVQQLCGKSTGANSQRC